MKNHNIKKRIWASLLFTTTTLLSLTASATAFLPQEPRSLAMGGTSVSVGNSQQAHYYNPALLVSTPKHEDFNFDANMTVRMSNNDELGESISNFATNNLFANFLTDLSSLSSLTQSILHNTDQSNFTDRVDSIVNAQQALASSTQLLRQGIVDVTGKSLSGHLNLGVFASVPNLDTSFTLYANAWTNFSIQGTLDPNDETIMKNIVDILNVDLTSETDTEKFTQLSTDIINIDPANSLRSTVGFKGAIVYEYGLSLARQFTVENHRVDIGITPKIMQVGVVDYKLELRELDEEGSSFTQDNIKEYTSFNIDIGLAREFGKQWKAGFMIKNLMPKTFKTNADDDKVKISPAMRIGGSYRHDTWATLAVDLDLTNNQDTASPFESRFLSLGAEADVWLLQLRAGYRFNLSSKGGNVPSFGLGLWLFGVDLDLAISGDIPESSKLEITELLDDSSFSAQLGFSW